MFGKHLAKLDKTMPVWVVQSVQNNTVVEELRRSGAINITTFVPEEFGPLMETIDEHHFGWRELEVYGLNAGDAAAALAAFGGGAFTSFHDGFSFERRNL